MQKIFVMGFVGREPEERFTNNDEKVTTFPIGINYTKGGEKRTVWYRINCWGSIGSQQIPSLKKGKVITVIGTLKFPTAYQAKNGDIKIDMTITCDSISFVPIPKPMTEKKEEESVFNFGEET